MTVTVNPAEGFSKGFGQFGWISGGGLVGGLRLTQVDYQNNVPGVTKSTFLAEVSCIGGHCLKLFELENSNVAGFPLVKKIDRQSCISTKLHPLN